VTEVTKRNVQSLNKPLLERKRAAVTLLNIPLMKQPTPWQKLPWVEHSGVIDVIDTGDVAPLQNPRPSHSIPPRRVPSGC